MASSLGFVGNAFQTHADLVTATKSLLQPIEQYRSAGGARVKIRPATVAAFDDVAAQLEGFARPLFGIGAFLGGDENDKKVLKRWMEGLTAGVDPTHEEYWGDMGNHDQRMVEAESISIALLVAADRLLPYLSEAARANLITWLRQINGRRMPENNWRWFRVFVNLTLIQVFGVPEEELEPQLAVDFETLDSFHLTDGWSGDGYFNDERRQADYYSGSFAMQFAQLLYVKFAKGNEERKFRYKQHARQFGADYWRYFDVDGAAIPFGRSMTYRFALSAFWAAAALAEVDLPAPVQEFGTVKGMLLRHLRWWATKRDIFNSDGILNIGFAFPNLYLSEDYNSPQSVYWCLKSLVILFLPSTHDFWQQPELPHPLADPKTDQRNVQLCKAMKGPRQIVNSSPEHHYMLSSGQMTTVLHKAKAAKYCKFAYSSAFGFSVPTGLTLHQMAPDSTITLSLDGGKTWIVRDCPSDGTFRSVLVNGQSMPSLTSTWQPFSQLDLAIETTLVPLSNAYPGWHIRVHRVKWSQHAERAFIADELQLVDGGFAVPAFASSGYHVAEIFEENLAFSEGLFQSNKNCLMRSKAGTCGVAHIAAMGANSGNLSLETVGVDAHIGAFVLRADPNTNLICSRTFIPCLQFRLAAGSVQDIRRREAVLVTGVFAVSPKQSQNELGTISSWLKPPRVSFLESNAIGVLN